MSEATSTAADLAQGRLLEQKPDLIVLGLPGTDYQLHLVPLGQVRPSAVGQIAGRIRASARRIDRMRAGGRFIEPVYGRPRTIQGTVVDLDSAANTLTIQCPTPFICKLMPDHRAADFTKGELVYCHVERGATFEQDK